MADTHDDTQRTVKLSNSDYHYVSELLACRASEVSKLIASEHIEHGQVTVKYFELCNESELIVSLLSEHFISI